MSYPIKLREKYFATVAITKNIPIVTALYPPAQMLLQSRGTTDMFWTVRVSHRDILEPAVEIDLPQARAVALALGLFDARNTVLGFTDLERKQRQRRAA